MVLTIWSFNNQINKAFKIVFFVWELDNSLKQLFFYLMYFVFTKIFLKTFSYLDDNLSAMLHKLVNLLLVWFFKFSYLFFESAFKECSWIANLVIHWCDFFAHSVNSRSKGRKNRISARIKFIFIY